MNWKLIIPGTLGLFVILYFVSQLFMINPNFSEGSSTSLNIDDDGTIRLRARWTDNEDDTRYRINASGEFEFSPDGKLTEISDDGNISLQKDGNDIKEEITIEPDDLGNPVVTYSKNDDETEMSVDAQQWHDESILFIIRRTGLVAKERVEYMLAQGGVSMVLDEIDEIEWDSRINTYMEHLVQQATLTNEELTRAILLIANNVDSSRRIQFIYSVMLKNEEFNNETMTELLKGAQMIDSDNRLAELLNEAADYMMADDAAIKEFAEALDEIHSYRMVKRAMIALLDKVGPELSDESFTVLLEASGEIEDDDHQDDVLRKMAEYLPEDGHLNDVFINAVNEGIGNQSRRERILALVNK